MKTMGSINGYGVAAAIIVWLVMTYIVTGRVYCARVDSCGDGNLLVAAIAGAFLIGPAYIAGFLVSEATGGTEAR